MQNLGRQIEKTQAQIDALQEEHGSNLESETELARLKQLKEIYKTELEEKKKKWPSLKNKQKQRKITSKSRQRKEKAHRNGKRKKRNRRKAEQHQAFG